MYSEAWLFFGKRAEIKRIRFPILFFLLFSNLSLLKSENLIHTSASDFNSGTFSNNGVTVTEDGTLKLGFPASDTLPEYHTGIGLPLKNFGMAIFNRRIYVSGGIDESGTVQSSVFSAPINFDGSVGSWKTENPLPGPRAHHTMSMLNGCLYVAGGADATNKAQNSVYRASISSNSGVGLWSNEPSLPDIRWRHAAAVTVDRIFISGGHDSSTIPQNTVYSAQANSDGSLNPWKVEEKSLPNRLFYHSMVESKNRLFVIGGKDGNSAQSAVYSIPIDTNGLSGAWKLEKPIPFSLYAQDAVVLGGDIYLTGGRNSNNETLSEIFHAHISQDGTLDRWNSFANNLQSPKGFHRSAVIDDQIYTLGGIDDVGNINSSIISIGISRDFNYGAWQGSINNLPIGNYGASAVIWNGTIYLMGGTSESNGISKNVYRAKINPDGSVGVLEQEQNSLPEARRDAKAAAWRNKIYLVGGDNGNTKPSSVYSAPINTDSTLGVWKKENDLPTRIYSRAAGLDAPQLVAPPPCCQSFSGTGRTEFAISIWNGRIYISGGSDSASGGGKEVLSAQIGSDGALGDWRYETAFPENVRIHGMTAVNGRLYVVQGYSGKMVYSASINSDGTLSGWSSVNSGLPGDTFPASLLIVNGQLHSFAGYPSGTTNFGNPGIARVNFTAPIKEDGSVGSWVEESNLLPSMAPYPNVFEWKGRFYVVGGGGYSNPFYIYSSGTPLYSSKGIYVSPIIDLGSIRRLDKFSWTQSSIPSGGSISVSLRTAEEPSLPLSDFKSVSNGETLKNSYARFVQYKVEMYAGGSIGIPAQDQTPSLEDITITHVEDPLPPALQSYFLNSNSIDLQIDNSSLDIVEVSTDNFSSINIHSGTESRFTISGLIPNTGYSIAGRKMNRDGRVSREVVLISTFTKSAAPADITTQEIKLNSLKYSWNSNGNPSGTTYLAKLYLGTKAELIEQKTTTSPELLFEKLSLGTKYTLYLYALNADNSLGIESTLSAKTKDLNPANTVVTVTTGSYTLEWSSQPEGLGYKIFDGSGKLLTDLSPDATYYFESGFRENEQIVRRVEFYAQSISSTIANASFFTAVASPNRIEEALSILEKGPTYIRLRVFPPPNPVGRAGVRVRIIPSTNNSAIQIRNSSIGNKLAANFYGAKIIDFTAGQWEQTVTGLTPGIQYSILTSYINSDGIESSPTSTTMSLALGFSPIEEDIKPETDRFFVNEGVNFQISSNQSGNGTIKVYDADQNQIRLIPFGYGSGNTPVKWDGKDDFGQSIFSGIYWIVIESAQFGRKTINVGAIR